MVYVTYICQDMGVSYLSLKSPVKGLCHMSRQGNQLLESKITWQGLISNVQDKGSQLLELHITCQGFISYVKTRESAIRV